MPCTSGHVYFRHAVSYFTEKYSSTSTRRTGSTFSSRRRTTTNTRLDGCNSFVFYGGILWLCLIGAVLLYAAKEINDRRMASGAACPAQLVQLHDLHVPKTEAESLPDAPPLGAANYHPSQFPDAALHNSEGFLFSNAIRYAFNTLVLHVNTVLASHHLICATRRFFPQWRLNLPSQRHVHQPPSLHSLRVPFCCCDIILQLQTPCIRYAQRRSYFFSEYTTLR